MALLADGLHMAFHATALGISVLAFVSARRLVADQRFTFGPGKINSLAAFASAELLGGFALPSLKKSRCYDDCGASGWRFSPENWELNKSACMTDPKVSPATSDRRWQGTGPIGRSRDMRLHFG